MSIHMLRNNIHYDFMKTNGKRSIYFSLAYKQTQYFSVVLLLIIFWSKYNIVKKIELSAQSSLS